MTKQRALIKKIVTSAKSHLSAQQVYEAAKQQMPTIAMATIYNNLNVLAECGAICRVKIDGRVELYDGELKPHAHLVCDTCGYIEDLHLEGVLPYIREEYKIDANSFELTIHYVCDKCKTHSPLH